MDLVEVPVQGERGWAALQAVSERANGRPFGAGTVLSPDDARRAAGLGARVIISPGLSLPVVEATRESSALPMPGVMTPTDVTAAAQAGLDICKLFPATLVGSGWLRAISGPFPGMRFIAVGGIDAHNAAGFLAAGASGVGFGSSVEEILSLDDPSRLVAALHEQVA